MGKDFCLFVSLAFPWFGLLCHISPLKVSSWHPTPVLTLRTDHIACTSASSLHLLPVGRHECVSCFSACNCHLVQILSWFFFFFLDYASLWGSKIPYWPACERVSYCLKTSPPSRLPALDGSLSWNSLSPFSSLSFVLPHFEEIGLPF